MLAGSRDAGSPVPSGIAEPEPPKRVVKEDDSTRVYCPLLAFAVDEPNVLPVPLGMVFGVGVEYVVVYVVVVFTPIEDETEEEEDAEEEVVETL